MIRQSILKALLMVYLACVIISGKAGMELEEEHQLPPLGIYVKEIETGKTAYIYWDRLPEERSFIWLEKESFEEYMGDTGGKKGTKGAE